MDRKYAYVDVRAAYADECSRYRALDPARGAAQTPKTPDSDNPRAARASTPVPRS